MGAAEDTATNHEGEVQRQLKQGGRQPDVRRKPLESDEEVIARELVGMMQQEASEAFSNSAKCRRYNTSS